MYDVDALAVTVLAGDADFFDIATGLINGTEAVVRAAFLVGAIIVVGATYFATRAFIPVLVAILLAGGVLWGINNARSVGSSATQTIQEAPRIDSPGQVQAQRQRSRGRRR
jgi:hypothetical protein